MNIDNYHNFVCFVLWQVRARRLRRLGLVGGEAAVTAAPTSSSTDNNATLTNEIAENIAKSMNTATKNTVCPASTEEHDDNQHKQKQQKFDLDAQLESGKNKNDSR